MLESQPTGSITTTVIDENVLDEMLRFIYTGKVEMLEELAGGLLAAADKYGLERLKNMCEEVLLKNLSTDTAVEMLIFSDQHNAEQLKAQILDYLNCHSAKIMETDGFKSMIETHPHLLGEAFRALATQERNRQKGPATQLPSCCCRRCSIAATAAAIEPENEPEEN